MTLIGRGFMVDNDPTIPVKAIREGVRVHPYAPGSHGTAVATFLAGESPLGAAAPAGETRFVEAIGHAGEHAVPQRLRVLGRG